MHSTFIKVFKNFCLCFFQIFFRAFQFRLGKIEIIGEHHSIAVKEEGQGSGTFFVILPASIIHQRKLPIKIGLYNGNEKVDEISTNFLGPISE